MFFLRRWVMELAKYPRIARGTLDFVWANAEGGPANSFKIGGDVQVEHDPATLKPLATSGRFESSYTWSGAPLQSLQVWWQYVVPEFYGVTCPATTPSFSDSAAMNAATFGDNLKLNLVVH